MMDVSEPLVPGDKIKYRWEGEEKTEEITESFWQERPKGGKEFCYRTKFGDVVPISSVIDSTKANPSSLQKAGLLQLQPEEPSRDADLLRVLIEGSSLPVDQKAIILNVLEDDVESLIVAKAIIEKKLKTLEKYLSSGQPTGGI